MAESRSSVDVSTKLQRVAKLAREAPDMAFRSLAHLIDIDWLREAYRRTRKDGARGVDGQSAQGYQADLERNLRSLLERAKYGLELHPDKTRLVNFRRPDRFVPEGTSEGPGTFDLLGFTHDWGKARSGKWVVKRKTAKDRFRRALKRVAEWCREHLHDEVRAQQEALARKLRGHFEYYGIVGNYEAIALFFFKVTEVWCKWLNRRSQRASMTWSRMHRLLERYPLPRPRIAHPLPPRAASP